MIWAWIGGGAVALALLVMLLLSDLRARNRP